MCSRAFSCLRAPATPLCRAHVAPLPCPCAPRHDPSRALDTTGATRALHGSSDGPCLSLTGNTHRTVLTHATLPPGLLCTVRLFILLPRYLNNKPFNVLSWHFHRLVHNGGNGGSNSGVGLHHRDPFLTRLPHLSTATTPPLCSCMAFSTQAFAFCIGSQWLLLQVSCP